MPLTALRSRTRLGAHATVEVCLFMSSSPSAEPYECGFGALSRVASVSVTYISAVFKVRSGLIFLVRFFHKLLDTTAAQVMKDRILCVFLRAERHLLIHRENMLCRIEVLAHNNAKKLVILYKWPGIVQA